jgi:hypothetical protein
MVTTKIVRTTVDKYNEHAEKIDEVIKKGFKVRNSLLIDNGFLYTYLEKSTKNVESLLEQVKAIDKTDPDMPW